MSRTPVRVCSDCTACKLLTAEPVSPREAVEQTPREDSPGLQLTIVWVSVWGLYGGSGVGAGQRGVVSSKGSGGENVGRERVRDCSLAYLAFESSILKSKVSLMMGPLRF